MKKKVLSFSLPPNLLHGVRLWIAVLVLVYCVVCAASRLLGVRQVYCLHVVANKISTHKCIVDFMSEREKNS